MKHIILILSLSLLVICATASADEKGWSYSGSNGPQAWASLSPEMFACAGKNQSPINLTGFIKAQLAPINIHYAAAPGSIVNTGHDIKIDYPAAGSIWVEGIEFKLKQFHFHAPSENQINGHSFPLEGHFVNVDSEGSITVLAVMFQEGKPNKALELLWQNIPADVGMTNVLPVAFNADSLLPLKRSYYRFNGSLTTPPCAEGVRWIVFKQPLSVSKQQLAAFAKVMGQPNNRPIQPLNARVVLE